MYKFIIPALLALSLSFGRVAQAQDHSYKWLNVFSISGTNKPFDHVRQQLENQANAVPMERRGQWGKSLIARVRPQATKGDLQALYKTGFGAYTYAKYGQDVFQQRARVLLQALNLIESFPKVPHDYEFTRLRYLLEGSNTGLYPRRVVEIGVSLLQLHPNDFDVEVTNWRIYNVWIDDFPKNKLAKLQKLQKKYSKKDLQGDFAAIFTVLGNIGDLQSRRRGISIAQAKLKDLSGKANPTPRQREDLHNVQSWLATELKYEKQYPNGVPNIIEYQKSAMQKRLDNQDFYSKI